MREIGHGSANIVYETENGKGIRVPINQDAQVVCEYWNQFWKPRLGKFMGPMRFVEHPELGPSAEIDIHGSQAKQCEIVAEFKPKWLTQSALAPKEALSCRTCAVKRMRGQPAVFCPLDLACKQNLSEFAQNVVPNAAYRDAVALLLQQSDLIDLLVLHTRELDTPQTQRHCMSLRDCTVLIERHTVKNEFKLYIVDLDPKLGPNKPARWAQIENELYDFYLLRWPQCRLSR